MTDNHLHPVIVRGIAASSLSGETRMLLVTLAAAGATDRWVEAWERDLVKAANVAPETVRTGLRYAQARNLVAYDIPKPGYYRIMLNRDEIAALAAASVGAEHVMLDGLTVNDEVEDVRTRALRSWEHQPITEP